MITQSITLDGQLVGVETAEPLLRAIIISLFTWRRANRDDVLPGSERMGWWGDAYATVEGDRIGSRLWLYMREAITPKLLQDLDGVVRESLAWLVDDNVLSAVDVAVERLDIHAVGIEITYTKNDGTRQVLRFHDVWKFLE